MSAHTKKQLLVVVSVFVGIVLLTGWYFISKEPEKKTTRTIVSKQMGYEQYTDELLHYGFTYPLSYSVKKCEDGSCVSIDAIKLTVQPVTADEMQTAGMEEFKSDPGFPGYKLSKPKQSTVYLFPLKKEVETDAQVTYTGVRITTDSTTQQNQAALDDIAASYFTF